MIFTLCRLNECEEGEKPVLPLKIHVENGGKDSPMLADTRTCILVSLLSDSEDEKLRRSLGIGEDRDLDSDMGRL